MPIHPTGFPLAGGLPASSALGFSTVMGGDGTTEWNKKELSRSGSCRPSYAEVQPPHRLGGAHKHGAPYSLRRALLREAQQVASFVRGPFAVTRRTILLRVVRRKRGLAPFPNGASPLFCTRAGEKISFEHASGQTQVQWREVQKAEGCSAQEQALWSFLLFRKSDHQS